MNQWAQVAIATATVVAVCWGSYRNGRMCRERWKEIP